MNRAGVQRLAASVISGLLVFAAAAILLPKHKGAGVEGATPPLDQCRVCHNQASDDPGGSHGAAVMGCALCHLGNPDATDKASAHAGLEREPGALDTVEHTCAQAGCHAQEGARVRGSLMGTARGIVAVDRWALGEAAMPDGATTMAEVCALAAPSAADSHLRKLCAGCHLATARRNRDDALRGFAAIGAGCSACHSPAGRTPGSGGAHPRVDARIDDSNCFGCHSRSARISLSYAGMAEISNAEDCVDAVALPDGRTVCQAPADVHQKAGLKCIDCHLHTDLMGDGTAWNHEEDQVEIACESCHGPLQPGQETTAGRVTDDTTARLPAARAVQRPAQEAVRLARRGTLIWNLRPGPQPGGAWQLRGKANGTLHPVKQTPGDANHTLRGHQRLTCTACHAAWVPTCTTCHTRFEPTGQQWDFGKRASTPGVWQERSDGVQVAPPTLAVLADGHLGPAIPGMVLDVDASAAGGKRLSQRLFAPLDPHTTGPKARSCASCHLSARTLGLGEGTLVLDQPQPMFQPAAPLAGQPGMAADAWTALDSPQPGRGTRQGVRSLDSAELLRTLRVGPCLGCHAMAQDAIYVDFRASLLRRQQGGGTCTGPWQAWLLPP